MRQNWWDLSFFHWTVDADVIQALLPAGLDVDTFDGKAYVGLVPFRMAAIRPIWAPPLPGLSWFYETNVRTYVHRRGRGPGVWFFSLEASNRIAVAIARSSFGLPYYHAQMYRWQRNEAQKSHSVRLESGQYSSTILRARGDLRIAEPGSLDFFLIERYLLYSTKGGKLMQGRVWHEPYPILGPCLGAVRDQLVSAAGITSPH